MDLTQTYKPTTLSRPRLIRLLCALLEDKDLADGCVERATLRANNAGFIRVTSEQAELAADLADKLLA
jgi:hypothetical protein